MSAPHFFEFLFIYFKIYSCHVSRQYCVTCHVNIVPRVKLVRWHVSSHCLNPYICY